MPKRSKRSCQFTNEAIKNLVLTSAREDWHDTEVTGLVLRVSASSNVWYYIGRTLNGLERIKLGKYPFLSVADARDHVKIIHAAKAKGEPNPITNDRDQMTTPTPTPTPTLKPLTTIQAAAILGIQDTTLRWWRVSKPADQQPPFTKMGRTVRYYEHLLIAWIDKNTKGLDTCKDERQGPRQ